MKINYIVILLSVLTLYGCGSTTHSLLQASKGEYPKDYQDFEEYLTQVASYLRKNRHFLTEDKEAEIAANMPFELPSKQRQTASKGILLIHGLGDSPWSFSDISQDLASRGFLVRTILLPGHGTRPGDMLNVTAKQWREIVRKQSDLLRDKVDSVYLGGFSTGGNLAYLEAVSNPDIKGLMLFSPGFKSDESLLSLTPFIKSIKPWLLVGNPDSETNYTRYTAMPTNGFAQYYQTSKQVMTTLEYTEFKRPVLMVLSKDDSVIDTQKVSEIYRSKFTHPDNRLLWFSKTAIDSPSVINVGAEFPEYRISNMSHMGVLFHKDNPYYGVSGSHKICNNGQETENAVARCSNSITWYSAWGYQHPQRLHARTTFNPLFGTMMNQVSSVFNFKEGTL